MSQLRKNTIFNIILIGSQFLLPIISFPYLTHVLGPDKIGVVNFIDSITMTLVNISALGIPIYGVREIARARGNEDALRKVFSELLIIHFSFSLFNGILYFFAIQYIPRLQEHKDLCYISLVVIFLNIFLVEWYYRGMEKFKYVTIRSIINRIIPVILMFIFIKSKSDYAKYYLILAFATMLNVIFNFAQLLLGKNVTIRSLQMKRHLKPLTYMLSSSIAISVYIYLNTAFLGFMASDESTGFYSSSVKVTNISLALITAMGTVIIPQLSKAYAQNDVEKIQHLTNKSFYYTTLLGLPITIMLIFYSDFIITLLAGNAFLPASTTLKILSLNILIVGFNNIFGTQILTTLDREIDFFKAVGAGMLISVALNFMLIPLFKHNGAAMTSVITELAVTLITYWYVLSKFKLHFDWGYFVKNAILSISSYLLVFIVVNMFALNIYLNITITFLAGSILYGLGASLYIKDEFVNGLIGEFKYKVNLFTSRKSLKL